MEDAAVVILTVRPSPAAVEETRRRAFGAALVTLTLGILGSSVLPVPWAFSRAGVAAGLGTSLAVAAANAYTGVLLLRAAAHTGRRTYEGVAEAAGGSRAWRLVAQAALISLLFGTLAGDAALLADTGALAAAGLSRGRAPGWLAAGGGRVPMALLVGLLVLPLSLAPKMRQLERAAAAGVALVALLVGVVVQRALAAGLPALASGELPAWRVARPRELPEAVSVLSFAFYTQPMLLPLLSEMPAGREGVEVMCRALKAVTMGEEAPRHRAFAEKLKS
jgi:amino acid permease